MSKEDVVYDAVERLEWDERKQEDTPRKRLMQVTRRTALTGGAAGIAALMIEACGGSNSSSSSSSGASTASAATGSGSAASSIFGSSKPQKFTLVNHVTTNPFFAPTQTGAADACKLLGCSYQWTGSQTSNISEMVNAFNTAVTAGVNGIGVALVDQKAFNAPVQKALSAGIPVVAYNADVPTNGRLAYIGQDLFKSGQLLGARIAQLVPSGDVALFIATPGQLNLQPRINGVLDVLKSHTSIKTHTVATGAAVPQELSSIQSYAQGHPNTKGMFAVDAGSTQSVGQTIQKQGLKAKIKGGGYDFLGPTAQLLSAGYLQVSIDQQPYLQGFLPILQLYMYNVSNKLIGVADVDTGIKLVDSATIKAYVTKSAAKYEA